MNSVFKNLGMLKTPLYRMLQTVQRVVPYHVATQLNREAGGPLVFKS